jgi:hypothetical protein
VAVPIDALPDDPEALRALVIRLATERDAALAESQRVSEQNDRLRHLLRQLQQPVRPPLGAARCRPAPVLVGGTGTGKTHLAIAIARSCIRDAASARFYIVCCGGPQTPLLNLVEKFKPKVLWDLGFKKFKGEGVDGSNERLCEPRQLRDRRNRRTETRRRACGRCASEAAFPGSLSCCHNTTFTIFFQPKIKGI